MGIKRHRLAMVFWCFFAIVSFCGPLSLVVGQDEQEREYAPGEFFTEKVAPIIKVKCLRCHQGKEAKAEIDFNNFDWVEGQVDPESYDSFGETNLATTIMTTSTDIIMPPVGAGELKAHHVAVFFEWFGDHEASVPESIDWKNISEDLKLEPAPLSDDPATLGWELGGRLHPALLHFPVALLMVSALLAIFGFGNEYTDKAAFYCLVFGTLGAIASCVSGWSFGEYKGWDWNKESAGELQWMHRWGGIATAVLSTLVLLIAFVSRSKENGSQFLWKLGILVVAGLVAAVGHFGGEKSHGDYKPLAEKFVNSLVGAAKPELEKDELKEDPSEEKPADNGTSGDSKGEENKQTEGEKSSDKSEGSVDKTEEQKSTEEKKSGDGSKTEKPGENVEAKKDEKKTEEADESKVKKADDSKAESTTEKKSETGDSKPADAKSEEKKSGDSNSEVSKEKTEKSSEEKKKEDKH